MAKLYENCSCLLDLEDKNKIKKHSCQVCTVHPHTHAHTWKDPSKPASSHWQTMLETPPRCVNTMSGCMCLFLSRWCWPTVPPWVGEVNGAITVMTDTHICPIPLHCCQQFWTLSLKKEKKHHWDLWSWPEQANHMIMWSFSDQAVMSSFAA